MRTTYFLTSLAVAMFATLAAGAQTDSGDGAAAPAPAANEPPPPGGYPPPPPGYYGPEQPAEREAKNSIYIEGLGPGILYSINYDRTFGDFAGRVGFSYIALSASANSGTQSSEAHASFITVPLTLTYLGIGSKKNIFEIGAGATIVHVGAGASTFATDHRESDSSSDTLLFGDLIFGYRLQPPDGGFLLRTGISPIFGHGVFIPLPYLALGGTF